MDFFKSVLSDNPIPFDNLHLNAQNDDINPNTNWKLGHSPGLNYDIGAWSFRDLICNNVRVYHSELPSQSQGVRVRVEERDCSDLRGGFAHHQGSSWFAQGRCVDGLGKEIE
ncbi:protein DOS2-like [Pyrus ussuriensis x Pyrus communis]|uniref:Protein DOS2-like n=1 Tax=Pyrus ussuriensis x Pyrus communis TaxID=2448454 RepID=A0A5N5H363_9ROSA|nr:protein DOS2-like [Pyrus ussuriensis x Pyrus communis]